MRALPVLMGLLVLASGCAGTGPGAAGATRPSAAFGADTGGVEGVVVDPEFRPVVGARVVLIGTKVVVNTTDEGRFAIGDLVPQQYLAVITKSGFVEKKQGFTVPFANVTTVRVVLEPIPPPVPYVDIANTFAGAVRTAYSVRVAGQGGNSSGPVGAAYPESVRTANSYDLRPAGNWQTILLELNWVPQSDMSDQLSIQVGWSQKTSTGGTTTQREWVVGGDPPLRWRLERTHWEAQRKANPNLYELKNLPIVVYPAAEAGQPVDVGLYMDQKFTLFMSIGYNAPIPGNHTRLPPS